MRTIRLLPSILFAVMVCGLLAITLLLSKLLLQLSDEFISHAALDVFIFIAIFYVLLTIAYRLCLYGLPFGEGEIERNSIQEFAWSLNMLFWLIFYHPLLRSHILPVPLTRVVNICLGARVGTGTYFSGFVFDPHFLEIGRNCIVGADSFIVPHAMEGAILSHHKIHIGDYVTIGMKSSVLAGVQIEDHAVVAAHSLVLKHTHIRAYEIWGGVPAKKIGMSDSNIQA